MQICLLTSWVRTGVWLRQEAEQQIDAWNQEADKVSRVQGGPMDIFLFVVMGLVIHEDGCADTR